MGMPAYLKNYELLTDDVLEGLIGHKVSVHHGGMTQAGVYIKDVSKRALWVQWPDNGVAPQEPFAIPLEDIVTLSYEERKDRHFRNPNMSWDEDD